MWENMRSTINVAKKVATKVAKKGAMKGATPEKRNERHNESSNERRYDFEKAQPKSEWWKKVACFYKALQNHLAFVIDLRLISVSL